MSESKKKDLQSRATKLTSNSIPTTAVKSDQYVSCDVYRDYDGVSKREDQLQAIREVKHIVKGVNTFNNENIDSHYEDIITGSFDGKTLKIKGFTARGYQGYKNSTDTIIGNQGYSTVFEEEINCGPTAPKNVSAPESTPSKPNIPNQSTSSPVGPTGVPTNPGRVDLPTATQGPAPTRVPPTTQATPIPVS